MSLIEALTWRYATKRMNGQRVPQTQVDRILEAVRLAPSSYGLQPYSVLVIEDRAGYGDAIKDTVNGFASAHEKFQWAAKQAYLALGTALAAAAAERVDASPMEGFDPAGLDDLLGLKKQNLRSVVLMALGYCDSESDRHAGLEKVRWPGEKLFIHMS